METKRIRSKVVMLATKYSRGFNINIPIKDLFGDGNISINNDFGSNETIFYHLYFTTDEKIPQEIDSKCVIYNPKSNKIIQNPSYQMPGEKLVVASTDTSLGLTQPSQAFIKKYVELGGIDEVDLECEEVFDRPGGSGYYFKNRLKVDPVHNTVTIHSIKDSWNREEVVYLLKKVMVATNIEDDMTFEKLDCWIKENL